MAARANAEAPNEACVASLLLNHILVVRHIPPFLPPIRATVGGTAPPDDCSPSHCCLSSPCVWYTVAEPSRGGVTQSPLHVEPRDSSSPDVTRRSVWGRDVLNVRRQTPGKRPLTLSRQVFPGRQISIRMPNPLERVDEKA